MSPKRDNNREIQDSTTDFFLKVIKKEKETPRNCMQRMGQVNP